MTTTSCAFVEPGPTSPELAAHVELSTVNNEVDCDVGAYAAAEGTEVETKARAISDTTAAAPAEDFHLPVLPIIRFQISLLI